MPNDDGSLFATGSTLVSSKVRGVVVSNFAWQHLKSATSFRDRVKDLESIHQGRAFGAFFEEIRTYASATIMMCVAAADALINELFLMPGILRSATSDIELFGQSGKGGILRKPLFERYDRALEKLSCPSITGCTAAKDMQLLVELRNALTHFEPKWDDSQQKSTSLENGLSGKFALSPFTAGADFVGSQCMSWACAEWSVATPRSYIGAFNVASGALESGKIEHILALE
ncbi:hypothetical protein BurMR1_1870 [Burkholderia sp. MR1]|nr:hypothetical protein BurMR1_1870 [Burkholderia sp. MR1]